MDLSDPKTWTDGLWVVVSAPHIVGPLLIAVGSIVWWFRGSVERPKRDGLVERLHNAKEQQSYLSQRLTDAQADITKLKQQIEDRAAPELLRDTVNSTARIVGDIAIANNDLGNTISDDGRKADPGRIVWLPSGAGRR
jgi:hypothetical protein